MSGAEDDVKKLLAEKARREQAVLDEQATRQRAIADEAARLDALAAEASARWPAMYQVLREIFDVYQPSLAAMGLESSIGGFQIHDRRYMFNFERLDKRASHKLIFDLTKMNTLLLHEERFTDMSGKRQDPSRRISEDKTTFEKIFKDTVEALMFYDGSNKLARDVTPR